MVVATQIKALGSGVSLALFGHGLQLQQVSYVISSLLHYPLQSHQRVELTFITILPGQNRRPPICIKSNYFLRTFKLRQIVDVRWLETESRLVSLVRSTNVFLKDYNPTQTST